MHLSDAKGSARDELQTPAMLHVCHLASRLQVQCTVLVACVSRKSLRSRGFVIMRTLFAIQITRNLEMKNPDLGAGGVTTASRPTYQDVMRDVTRDGESRERDGENL